MDDYLINCIHTEINKGTLYELQNKNLFNYSKKIKLSKEDEWFALNSWVEGIANSGDKALKIQSEIEYAKNFVFPLSSQLLRFIIKHNENYLEYFIFELERNYEKNRELANNYLKANLMLLNDIYSNKLMDLLVKSSIPYQIIRNTLINHFTYIPSNYNDNEIKKVFLINPLLINTKQNIKFNNKEIQDIKYFLKTFKKNLKFEIDNLSNILFTIFCGFTASLCVSSVYGMNPWNFILTPLFITGSQIYYFFSNKGKILRKVKFLENYLGI